jgi:hypothetical protein
MKFTVSGKEGCIGCLGCYWAATYVVPELKRWRISGGGGGGEYLDRLGRAWYSVRLTGFFSTPVEIQGFKEISDGFPDSIVTAKAKCHGRVVGFSGASNAAFVPDPTQVLPNAAACIEPTSRCDLLKR